MLLTLPAVQTLAMLAAGGVATVHTPFAGDGTHAAPSKSPRPLPPASAATAVSLFGPDGGVLAEGVGEPTSQYHAAATKRKLFY